MSDDFNIKINIKTSSTSLLKKSFDILKEYVSEEHHTLSILNALPQMTSILKQLQETDFDMSFLEQQDFILFRNKIKLLTSFPEANEFLETVDSQQETLSFSELREDVIRFFKSGNKDMLVLAHAYTNFYDVLKNSLAEDNWINIQNSWNDNMDKFDSDRISPTPFKDYFDNQLPDKIYSNYFKLIKLSQEKIAGALWNNFLINPENSQKRAKFVPDFFQFINWMERSDYTTRSFVNLLEQRHWDNLQYASKIKGFDFFLEKMFLFNKTELKELTNPWSTEPQYGFINLDALEVINIKNINIDVVLKGNSLGLPEHLRDYLYHYIDLYAKQDKKYSDHDFEKLDKLLTVYEKQKLDSIFIPKKTKQKTHKI